MSLLAPTHRGAPTSGWSLSAADGRDNHFNLIRMIAATGVLVSHAFPISRGPEAWQPFEETLGGMSLGAVSVHVFFAVSGYFIAQSYARSASVGRFLAARALRLFPALVVVLLLTVAIAALWLTEAEATVFWPAAAAYFMRNVTLFFLQYDLPGVFEDNPYGPAINGSLWTLGYEVICYAGVLVAGVAGLLARRWAALAVVATLIVTQVAAPHLDLHPRLAHLIDLGLPFAIGTALFVWRDRVVLDWRILAALGGAAAVAHGAPLFHVVFVVALCYGTFCFGCAPSTVFGRYNRLGDYSYGAYVYAFPIQQLVAWHGVTSPLLNIALAGVGTLVCAVLSWTLVEKPALRLKDTLGRPRTVADRGAPA